MSDIPANYSSTPVQQTATDTELSLKDIQRILAGSLRFVQRHWVPIISITVLVTLLALALSFIVPPTYEAKATLLLLPQRAEITIDPNYRMLTPEQVPGYADATTARRTLTMLIQSDEVKRKAGIQRDDDATASLLPSSSLIELQVRSTSQSKAQEQANTWAMTAQQYILDLYNRQNLNTEQVQSAQASYDKANQAVLAFDKQNQVALLESQIDQLRQEITTMMALQRNNREQAALHRTELALQTLNARTKALARASSLLADAESLQAQLQKSGTQAGPGMAFSVTLLQMQSALLLSNLPLEELSLQSQPGQTITSRPTISPSQQSSIATQAPNSQVQVQPGVTQQPQLQLALGNETNIDTAGLMRSVDGIITQIKTRQNQLEQERNAAEQAVLDPSNDTLSLNLDDPKQAQQLDQYNKLLLDLQTKYEQQVEQKAQLVRERDVASNALSAALAKQAELKLRSTDEQVDIRIATQADHPEIVNQRILYLGSGLVLGLLLGIILALTRESSRAASFKQVQEPAT